MSTRVEHSAATVGAGRITLVEELCENLVQTHAEDAEVLCAFAREFFAKLPRQLAQDRGLEALSALTLGAFHFLEASRPERVNVQIVDPESEGWSAPVTVVRVVLRDRPFIVDTVHEMLRGENIPIQHYIHPVVRLVRDDAGRIERLGTDGDGEPEAVIHCEIARIHDAERREAIRAGIERRLQDVVSATSDFDAMVSELERTAATLQQYAARVPERAAECRESEEFLRWLRNGNFVFLGYRGYDIVGPAGSQVLRVEPASGLGILAREDRSTWSGGTPLAEISAELRRRVVGGPLLIISKTNAEATVHRRARMDYIGVKKLDEEGKVVGERRFLGLFTSKAYAEHADAIPILRGKLEKILLSSGAAPGSHDYKEINTIFSSMPKEELFQATAAELEREIHTVLGQLFTDQVSVTLRPDPLRRGVSVMAILPRGKFSADIRHRIQDALARRLGGDVLNYHLAMGAGDQARLHFYLAAPSAVVEDASGDEIEHEIRQIIRSWEDRVLDTLMSAQDAEEATRLARLYGEAFNEEYRTTTPPRMAAFDIDQLERMWRDGLDVAIALRQPAPEEARPEGVSVLNLYLRDERLVLSDFMPTLENAGVRALEVNPYASVGAALPRFTVYTFAVQDRDGRPLPLEKADILAEMLLAVRRGDTPDDPFNMLVLRAGLRWHEVDLIRTYANYAFQIGAVPTRYGPARALDAYPDLARLLLAYFSARFDPALQETGVRRQESGEEGGPMPGASVDEIRASITAALEQVKTLADDRAIRRMIALIEATTRTNYFRSGGADPTVRSGGVPYISVKIRCVDVEELRKSRLLFETFVFSSRMEGIHLRGAPVSRGGIRWSDRPDDFRTEVMGLVQTQVVKNAVIVPSGSKGGFVVKRYCADRDELLEEAAQQYRTLIRGMLDITDNLVDGNVVPPEQVVRHDGDDPYLVVAADKGTAHLSDVANTVAHEYGFWLGDAFASGGSYGYDHKAEGITARGAWECVKRHFREMGKDIQAEPFTVAGIGDMSGDVFGNGMLLSEQIRLVAAFDHRHIFIDPDPDPAVSFAERKRMFALPRSSWDDYDRSTLSPGAMIVPRGSKEVTLTEEARAALGVEATVEKLDGEALIRTVLRAPVELLWNGGIGTYVKDREETHSEVGDPGTDPVRVNADELRCDVVGEGGNLGFTQRGRITYALGGGHINTDALDNSAGVDMSDHEVNLKILLNPMVTSGAMGFEERNRLLEEMTDEVNRLVLHNNVGQSLAVSLDEARSREALGDFAALITSFERERLLERGAEGIPASEEIQDRAREGIGLTRPTLCVLLAYAKLHTGARMLDSHLPDDPATEGYLVHYFPDAAVAAVGHERLRGHRLRREIITTQLVNDLVDLMGASFLHRVARDTGKGIDEVVRAWYMASRISGAAEVRADVERLEGRYPSETLYRWIHGLARVLERTTRWILANVPSDSDTAAFIGEHHAGLTRLRTNFNDLVRGEDRELFIERMGELTALGVDEVLAARLITLRFLPALLDILRIARETGGDAVETARTYYRVAEHLSAAWLQQVLRNGPVTDPWEKRLVQSLLADVGRAHRAVAKTVLECQDASRDIEACLSDFDNNRARELEHYNEILTELRSTDAAPLAAYTLAVRALRAMAGV